MSYENHWQDTDPYAEGQQAFKNGLMIENNPYLFTNSDGYKKWRDGFVFQSKQVPNPTEQMAQQIAKKREQEIEQMRRMRALRLDHWRKCLAARERAKASEVRADALEDLTDVYTKGYCVKLRNSAAEQHAVADDHLAAVITLNYYFDQGDTAEKDAAK